MAKRRVRKTQKSKWSRRVNKRPKKTPRRKLTGKKLAKFQFLMGGGSLDESE